MKTRHPTARAHSASRPGRETAFAGCILLQLLLSTPADGQPSLDWLDRRQLEQREVLIAVDDDGRFRRHIAAAALIHATPERIWAILEDCESAPEYVPKVLSCESIETLEGGDAELFRQEVKFAWFLPRFEHVFRLDYDPYRKIEVHGVSGPFEQLEGAWWLIPESADRTLLVYSLDFEAGLPVPRFVVGATLRRDLPTVLAAVRQRAEAPD